MKQTRVRVLLCALAALSPAVAAAEIDEASLTCYAETIDFDSSGGATVTVRCCVTGLAAGYSIAMPYAHAAWPDSFVTGDAVRGMLVRTSHGREQLFLSVARDVGGQDTLEYRFFLPHASPFGREATQDFGVRTIAYRLVQTFPQAVQHMTVRVILPEGTVVNKMVATTPARKGNSPLSPYAIEKPGTRHCVTLTDSTVEQGDILALTFEAKAEAKSPLILAALALCALAYLILFRDLVKPENGKPKTS